MDSKYNVINRTVYSMTDMFGQIGGMDSILVSAGSILVGIFSSKIFMASLLSSFYYVNSENDSSKVVPDNKIEESKESIANKKLHKLDSISEFQIEENQNKE